MQKQNVIDLYMLEPSMGQTFESSNQNLSAKLERQSRS